MFLHWLLWRWGGFPDYDCTCVVRRGGDECAELTEGACSLLIEFLCGCDVCVQWCGDLALLLDLDGICCRRWICGRSVCAANECERVANDRCSYRMRNGGLFLLEEWLMK